MKKWRRILSLALTLVMVLGMLPMNVLAEEPASVNTLEADELIEAFKNEKVTVNIHYGEETKVYTELLEKSFEIYNSEAAPGKAKVTVYAEEYLKSLSAELEKTITVLEDTPVSVERFMVYGDNGWVLEKLRESKESEEKREIHFYAEIITESEEELTEPEDTCKHEKKDGFCIYDKCDHNDDCCPKQHLCDDTDDDGKCDDPKCGQIYCKHEKDKDYYCTVEGCQHEAGCCEQAPVEEEPETPAEKPDAPTKAEVKALLGADGNVKINMDCAAVSGHDKVYGWVEDAVQIGEVVQDWNDYVCEITFDGSAYAAEYNDDFDTKHTFSDKRFKSVTLVWDADAEKWTAKDYLVTFHISCEGELELQKYVSDKRARVGETIVYTLEVSNNTSKDLDDVIISDPMLDVFKKVDIDSGETWKESFKYRIGKDCYGDTIKNTFYISLNGKKWMDSNTVKTVVADLSWHVNLTKDHIAYIEGYGDDTVRPEDNITRAEIATIFYRLLTDKSRIAYETNNNPFSDVNKGDWFNTAVSTMANAGVMNGYPDGTFRPDEPITRAELASVVACFVDWSCDGYGYRFYDVKDGHWASEKIAIAYYFGWVKGYSDGSFRPDARITRAETVTLINRVLERAVERHEMLPGMVEFDDCNPGDWFYEDIQEAANTHTFTRTNERVPGQGYRYESWTRLLD